MAKKKPYSDSKITRTLPKSATKNNNRKKGTPSKSKSLENTMRIRVDEGRVNDSESLDTSFLEGRSQSKVQSNKVEKEKILKEKDETSIDLGLLKRIFYILGVLCIVSLVILVLFNNNFFLPSVVKPVEEKVFLQDIPKKTKVVDSNYLFIGDYYTHFMDVEDLGIMYPYVKVSNEAVTISDVLGNMDQDIYRYNPSVIFIQLGLTDLLRGESIEDTIKRYEELLKEIGENRPYANIYIESLYPVNKEIENYHVNLNTVNNDIISEYNLKLQSLAKKLDVHYVDLYTPLKDKEVLKSNYTEDGFSLNKDGYKRVWKVLQKIISNEK